MIENLVSVIMPSYNSYSYIEKSIDSVINQTYENFELIIVDDKSDIETINYLKKIEDSDHRIKVVYLNENSGAAVARNKGMEFAKGRFIAFLDSDDLWVDKKLEQQLSFMKSNHYAFSFTRYYRVKENGEKINEIEVPKSINYNELLKNTIIGCSTVMIDRKYVEDTTMPLIRKGQDTATWLKILKKVPFAYGYNKESLTIYTERSGSISSNKLKALKRTWYIYRNIEKINFFKSLFYFSHYIINAFKKRLKV